MLKGATIPTDIEADFHALQDMTRGVPAGLYREQHDQSCRARHRACLIRKSGVRALGQLSAKETGRLIAGGLGSC